MIGIMLLCAGIIISCLLANRFSDKFGMPALLLFMALGMFFGSDGLFSISFDNYKITEDICTLALTFIMFYGGFCTKWSMVKPVAKKSILLSTVGVIITTLLTGLFCYFVLKINFLESLLIGAIISPTDAASVFSILRSKKLNLKDGTSSLLEIESGSNDPVAYMLTVIILSLINGNSSISTIPYMIFSQIVYGVVIGIVIAKVGAYILEKTNFITNNLDTIFAIAIALISFSLPELIGGNGYLSVYLTGIILGNSNIKNKIVLVHFFDGITGLCQIIVFFLLGLLSFPHKLPSIIITSLLIALLFIVRPIAVFIILLPFKSSINQCLLVSYSGIRGASSIVFSIIAIASSVHLELDLFHIIFTVSLISVAFQGSLLPMVAEKLHMIDKDADVRKTFNDYQEDSSISLMRMFIPRGHSWENKKLKDVHLPIDSLALMIKRETETLIPKGNTTIHANDTIILSVPPYHSEEDIDLQEISIDKKHDWCNKAIEDLSLPDDILIAMIKRNDENLIPRGKTKILENDVVIIYN